MICCRVIVKPVEDWDNTEDDLKYFQPRVTDHRRTQPAKTGQNSHRQAPPRRLSAWRTAGHRQSDLDRPVGSSAAYHIAMHKILRVAGTNATVLLLGESGVGKTMFAHELHSNSLRANTAFH